tara:strand:+ start:75 stop:935 length:861 start_codon:yes stop_codon:yes gene_type:complete
MKNIKYLIQFIFAFTSLVIFKLLGPNISSYISGKIFEKIGPFFRSNKIILSNINRAFPNIDSKKINILTKSMWNNYGRVFAEYVFIKQFRFGHLSSKIKIEGKEILDEIKNENKQVIFISGHFSNFELMAMCIEKHGINLSAIYRPLNNFFLNVFMERIRRKYICRNQIKKGIGGMRKLIDLNKKNFSTALMIDQRVSEGIKINFFNQKAFTTTIPAQLVKKFNLSIVPVFIERSNGINFRVKIHNFINFSKNDSIENITVELNKILEKMILQKPEHWIWSHNRWK